jgi:hypothetical protein
MFVSCLVRRPRLAAVLLALPLAATGCSGGPRVLEVTGTVTHGGHPVSKLIVHFVPTKGRPSWANTDPDGHYRLNYLRDRDGALEGTHKVWVEIRPGSPKEEDELRSGRAKLDPALKSIVAKYGKADTTPLTVEVKENRQIIDLHLD